MIGDIVAKLTEEKLKAALATGEFLPVYCLYGSETYLITHYASGLAEKSVHTYMNCILMKNPTVSHLILREKMNFQVRRLCLRFMMRRDDLCIQI